MAFADRLKAARKRTGITQLDVARKLGLLNAQSYAQYEQGTRRPKSDTLAKIAEALNIGYAYTKNGEPYFYTFVDTTEPEDSEDNIFNRNQQLDAMNDDGISIRTFEGKEENGRVFNFDTNSFERQTKKVIDLTDEAKLIDGYNNLNEQGKKEAIKRIEEMAYIPEYQQHDE